MSELFIIYQVENDLRSECKKKGMSGITISTVPQVENLETTHIFIFTQERLHWFLIEYPTLPLDILIVDEAQKIDDGNRGILLQHKIEDVVSNNPAIRIYFSSPFTSNPGILLDVVKAEKKKKIVDTPFIAVNQNLIYVNQVYGKVKEYEVSLCLPEQTIAIGKIGLKHRPNTEPKKIALIAYAFSNKKDGNLIYANGAADAEELAAILYDLIEEDEKEDALQTKVKLIKKPESNKELEELIKLIKKTIHKDYSLAKVLSKGIAFHYGNMPLLIRQEIERLFKKGDIKYLICTSTLLEGVNLPTKSIFIRKPKRGNKNPLNENDFWNLAGRAGRRGKEFSGNIICINPKERVIPPNPNKGKQKIKRALDIINHDNGEELINYIKEGSPRKIAESRQDLEFSFGYYYIRYLENKLDPNNELHSRLIEIFNSIGAAISIPNEIIMRNPGISPLAQQELYNYFETKKDNMETLIPLYPEDENAYKGYINLVGRIGKTIAYYPWQLNTMHALLLQNWMSGKPLSYIISKSYESYQGKPKFKDKKTLPVVIREVMENVETFVRFKFAKDSSCYIDVLRFFLRNYEREDLIEQIPEFQLWLEFGVNQKTQLSLLSLGLSRNTAIEVSKFIVNSEMTKDECIEWLKKNDYSQLGLSQIVIKEIDNAIDLD